MIEMVQFIQWLGRKVFGSVLNLLALIPMLLKKFREELNEQFVFAMLGWTLATTVSVALVAVGSLPFSPDPGTVKHLVLFVIGISLGILVIVGCQALYDAFKADQQRVIEALRCKEYGNQEIDEE